MGERLRVVLKASRGARLTAVAEEAVSEFAMQHNEGADIPQVVEVLCCRGRGAQLQKRCKPALPVHIRLPSGVSCIPAHSVDADEPGDRRIINRAQKHASSSMATLPSLNRNYNRHLRELW